MRGFDIEASLALAQVGGDLEAVRREYEVELEKIALPNMLRGMAHGAGSAVGAIGKDLSAARGAMSGAAGSLGRDLGAARSMVAGAPQALRSGAREVGLEFRAGKAGVSGNQQRLGELMDSVRARKAQLSTPKAMPTSTPATPVVPSVHPAVQAGQAPTPMAAPPPALGSPPQPQGPPPVPGQFFNRTMVPGNPAPPPVGGFQQRLQQMGGQASRWYGGLTDPMKAALMGGAGVGAGAGMGMTMSNGGQR